MEGTYTDKTRTASTESSASSVIEYVNEAFEESELESSKVVSIQVTNDVHYLQNPLYGNSSENQNGIKDTKKLQDFTEIPSPGDGSYEFIPRGFRKMYLASLVVLLFAVCMGVTATYTATALGDMAKHHSSIRPTPEEISWIGSFMPLGALIGGTAGGFFSNYLGRKGSLMLNSLPFVTGWLLIAYAETIGMIYIGRFITGFSTGIVSVTTPMYLVEISTPDVRGLLGASFQLFVVLGIVIITSLGAGLSWRWTAISGGLITLLATALMLVMPESPKWLMAKKRREEAQKTLTFLHGESFDAEAECQMIEEEIKNQPAGSVQLKEFGAAVVYKPFILSILLMFFQQFSGINAVLFYTIQIFKNADVSLDPAVATIIVNVVQLFATLLSSVLMDKAGRKPLLLTSAICMAVSLFVFGGYDLARSKNPGITASYGWLPVVCMTSFISAFAIGYGPTPWLMVAEMTSVRFRSIVSGIATGLNWTFVFIITYSFDKLVTAIQSYGAYWLYGFFCLCSIAVTVLFLPETKGKSPQELEEFFNRRYLKRK